jgi:antitoxin component YwqK of YwqJK toxin-antitoxin module
MKRIRLFIGLLFVTVLLFSGCKEKRVLESELIWQPADNYMRGLAYHNGELFTGIAFSMSNNTVIRETQFRDGSKDGFYKSKQLMAEEEGQYKEGMPIGEWKIYNSNGEVVRIDIYENGRVVKERAP